MNKFKIGDVVKVQYTNPNLNNKIGTIINQEGYNFEVDLGFRKVWFYYNELEPINTKKTIRYSTSPSILLSVKVTPQNIYGLDWLNISVPEEYEIDQFQIIDPNLPKGTPYLRIDGGLGFSDAKPWGFPRFTLKKILRETATIQYYDTNAPGLGQDYWDEQKQKYFRIIRKENK